jgi:heme-degrading monooxygenase HmoA
MPPLPWTTPAGTATGGSATGSTDAAAGDGADGQVVVMASLLKLTSAWRIPGFLRAAMAIRRQSLASDGVVGMSLDTDIRHRTFFTLSAWRDREALNSFVRSEPHRSLMRRYHPAMADAKFVFWDMQRDQLPPAWPDAQERLKASR